MKIKICKGRASGMVKAPPSKSFAHRQLICAAFAEGESVINGIYMSEDVAASIDCARALGADIRLQGDTAYIKPGELKSTELNCRESGSTLRFFIPLCMSYGIPFTLTGSERLLSRPQDVYERLSTEQGLTFLREGGKINVCGRLDTSDLHISGAQSSQFLTGLLLASPLSAGDSRITVTPPFVSRPYADMTLSVMSDFGVDVTKQGEYVMLIPSGMRYKGRRCTVEGDWSSAAFLDALGMFGDVRVTGLNENSVQGDKIYREYYKQLEKGRPVLDITDCPDNGPVLMALAAAFNGATLTGTSRLKIKESDRGAAMASELAKLGSRVELHDDSIDVYPGISAPKQPLYGHNDHRIVMALAVLLTLVGGEITGAEASGKSYPGFFGELKKLGIGVKEDEA